MATSETIYGGDQQFNSGKSPSDDANSLPLSNSFSSSLGSDLVSSHKSIRMPCKMTLKKLKRHSLPETADTQPNGPAAVRKMSKQRKRAIKAGHRRALFTVFLRTMKTERKTSTTNEENEQKVGKGSTSSGGLWKRARQIMKMSGSSSQGSLGSMKKNEEERNAGREITSGRESTEKNREEQIQIVCTTDETPL